MSKVLSLADVDRIAALARLALTDEERTLFTSQLTAILAYADAVQAVDTSAVDAAAIDSPVSRARDDEPAPSLDRATLLEQAPAADRAAGLFKVPRVIGS